MRLSIIVRTFDESPNVAEQAALPARLNYRKDRSGGLGVTVRVRTQPGRYRG